MKYLILGATGMAGHTIALYFLEGGHSVTAFGRRPTGFCKSIIGDAMDTTLLKEVIQQGEYDVVINAVGILNQFAEMDKSTAILVNSYLPHFLCKITEEMHTKVIHMSTDCVFSGQTGNYSENALRDGESFYDRTKALGEIENEKDLTFRNSIIGPDINPAGIGLFNWFMKQEGTIHGFKNAIWTGVTTVTLARAMERAVEENLSGLYHLVNNTEISKYELIGLFNKYFRHDEMTVVPDGRKMPNKSLRNMRTDFSFVVPDYDEMIKDMHSWVDGHRKFYPHYF